MSEVTTEAANTATIMDKKESKKTATKADKKAIDNKPAEQTDSGVKNDSPTDDQIQAQAEKSETAKEEKKKSSVTLKVTPKVFLQLPHGTYLEKGKEIDLTAQDQEYLKKHFANDLDKIYT